MAAPLMLGNIEILPHAGAPELGDDVIGGSSILRMSNGDGLKMTRWEKLAFTISAEGLVPPALDGLNYKEPLEFRSNQVSSMQRTDRVFTLVSTPRPDHAPWGYALVGDQLQRAPVSVVGNVVTVADVPGARLYQVWWFPVYSVIAKRPTKSQSPTSRRWGWSLAMEEA